MDTRLREHITDEARRCVHVRAVLQDELAERLVRIDAITRRIDDLIDQLTTP